MYTKTQRMNSNRPYVHVYTDNMLTRQNTDKCKPVRTQTICIPVRKQTICIPVRKQTICMPVRKQTICIPVRKLPSTWAPSRFDDSLCDSAWRWKHRARQKKARPRRNTEEGTVTQKKGNPDHATEIMQPFLLVPPPFSPHHTHHTHLDTAYECQ